MRQGAAKGDGEFWLDFQPIGTENFGSIFGQWGQSFIEKDENFYNPHLSNCYSKSFNDDIFLYLQF